MGRNLFMSAAKNTVRIQRMCVAALLCERTAEGLSMAATPAFAALPS